MELKNGVKNFFKKILEFILVSIFGLGVIYYIGSTDWYNEFNENQERLNIEESARSKAESLGSEGVELQSKLSLLIIRRDTITDEPELKILNEEIKKTVDEIQTKYNQYIRDSTGQIKGWYRSVEDKQRIHRTAVGMGLTTTTLVLKKEWCYSAYQTAYWKTAYSHCEYHAKLNDAKAQYFLGSILENGSGVSKDTLEAYVWYSIAALNDYDAAVVNLKNLSSTLNSSSITSMNQKVIRCINSNFSEC